MEQLIEPSAAPTVAPERNDGSHGDSPPPGSFTMLRTSVQSALPWSDVCAIPPVVDVACSVAVSAPAAVEGANCTWSMHDCPPGRAAVHGFGKTTEKSCAVSPASLSPVVWNAM